ncbi:MAG: YHS domain-containing protein [Planctomycetota bacterium]|jgi:class 3 adenylate cyclase
MTVSEEIDVVFLIADLSGYTALTEAHGNLSAAKIVARYSEIVNEVLHPDAQLVEKVGDEVLIVTANAASVIHTAIRLRDTIELEPLFPFVHAGIHAGMTLKQGGRYFGKALNLTSRVAAHARASQILCTERVITLAVDLNNIAYRSLGLASFKNIVEPIKIFEVITGDRRKKINRFDPVCHMQVNQDTAPAKLPYQGKTYYFCSFDCAKTFATDPEQYLGS